MTAGLKKAIRCLAGVFACLLMASATATPCFAAGGETAKTACVRGGSLLLSYEPVDSNYGDAKAPEDLQLTGEEQAYISRSPRLTVALSLDMAPMEYYNEEAKCYAGITVDLYERISQLTGLRFNYVHRGDTPELIAQMDAGEVQLTGALAQNPAVAQALHINHTEPFYINSMTAVTKDFSALTEDSVVAVPAGYPQFVSTAESKGYTKTREYDTFEQCVRAVYEGEAELTYIISLCEGYLLSHAQYSNLRAVADGDTEYGVSLGVKDSDAVLLSIINKALSAIPEKEINAITVSNAAAATPTQLPSDLLAENGGLILIILLLSCAFVTVTLVRWQKSRQQLAFTRELQQQHDLLERLYENLPCGVLRYAYEPPHKILSCNAIGERIFGYDDGAPFTDKSPGDVVAPGTEAEFQREFDRCEETGEPTSYIWQISRRDGSLAYTESVMDIVETAQGKVFQEVFIDVTGRVLKEQETEKRYAMEIHKRGNREQGLLFMAFFDVTERRLVETDIQLPGIRAGASVEDFISALRLRLQDSQTGQELDAFVDSFNPQHLERAYSEGRYEWQLLLRRCQDGHIQWLRSDLVLRDNPITGHLMCFDYIWDVTDEHVKTQISQRMAFADIESYMCVYIKTGCCLLYEGEGGRLRSQVEYGRSDVISRLCASMSQQGAQQLLQETQLAQVVSRLEEKPFYQVYATLYDRDKQRLDKSLSFFYLDKDLGILAVTLADVTEVRAAEVLHARQLSEALSAAEKADKAKSQFLSRVSHEIRTPLNAIIGYGTIAKNEMSEARTDQERRQAEMKVMDCLTKSDLASKHLLTIINDVLDMSAIDAGKILITRDRFDFKGLINSLTTIFYSQASSKGVELQVHFEAQMEEWVIGDQMRVNQVLTNLLSNAVKFTPEGGRVRLSIRPETGESKVLVTFTVADTGIGMTEDYLQRIFEPFEQADSYISRRFGGTGLGLTITKTLVDLMDGEISVTSRPGQGSSFTVKLSFDRTQQPAQRSAYDFTNINALIVDDDSGTCDYMALLLNRYNVRSSAVHSGMEALTLIKAAMAGGEPFTVCFVDWRMPGMDGLETSRRIREIAGNDMPIIVITAYDYSEIARQSAELGIDRFLSKPLFQSSLFDLLAELCGSPRVADAEKLSHYDFSGSRLLLAEDNSMNMEIAGKILETAGFTVDRAWNGQEAVDAFQAAPAGRYQAILMDVQMPVMDGYQATRTIRASAHPQAATIPIIAMTADAFAENIAESLSAGMNDHISKPIDLPTLFDTLSKYIHKG